MAGQKILTEDNKFIGYYDDDGTIRLAVDAQIVGGSFQLTPFAPRMTFDSAGVSLNTSTWNTLLDITGSGKLDFVAIAGSSANYRVRLTVDGTVIFNISMDDLNDIGLSNATNVPMWAETANKNFRYHPNTEVDYETNIKFEVMATSATPTIYYLINHRNQIV